MKIILQQAALTGAACFLNRNFMYRDKAPRVSVSRMKKEEAAFLPYMFHISMQIVIVPFDDYRSLSRLRRIRSVPKDYQGYLLVPKTSRIRLL
jgi:hypothetical protein